MSRYAVLSFRYANIAVLGFALILPLSGVAADSIPPEALHVTVLPDRYIAAGKPFEDVAGLEAWAKPIRIRTLWLDSCGTASTKRLLAAVERFHSAYPAGVQIRTFGNAEPRCLAWAADQGNRGDVPSGFPRVPEYYAIDQNGRSMMP